MTSESIDRVADRKAGRAPLEGRVAAAGKRRRWSALSLVPPLTLALFLGPIAGGLIGTWAPAFGILPALGGTALSLDPWRALVGAPGLAGSVMLSAGTGLGATLLSVGIALWFCAAWHGTRVFAGLRRLLAPLLALPHAAFAIGFAFLVAPSGWLARLLSPWATGWTRPPDLATVNDPMGLALVLGLVVKEVPFLLLMTVAALNQVRADRTLTVARTMGYGPVTAWGKTVLPLVYPQLRLPIYAVLAFSASVVDMALILGPGAPPTLGGAGAALVQRSGPRHALSGGGGSLPATDPGGGADSAVAAGRGGGGPARAALGGIGTARRYGGVGEAGQRRAGGGCGGGGDGGFHRAGAVVGGGALALSRCPAGRLELGDLDAGAASTGGSRLDDAERRGGFGRGSAGSGAGMPGERAARRAAAFGAGAVAALSAAAGAADRISVRDSGAAGGGWFGWDLGGAGLEPSAVRGALCLSDAGRSVAGAG